MIAKVILNSKTLNLNRTFDYEVPKELEDKLHLGSRVLVPFGEKNSLRDAFILDFTDISEYECKQIHSVVAGELIPKERITLRKDYV